MRVVPSLLTLVAGLGLGCEVPDRALAAAEVALLEPPTQRTVEGISIRATAGAWPGSPHVLDEVTPVGLTIVHRGDRPLRIHYGDFQLVDHVGHVYAALPPLDVRPGPASSKRPPSSPTLRPNATRFSVAPHFAWLYPHAPVDPRLRLAADYYELHYTYWHALEGPTPDMIERAIPEGVLEPGGRLDGYLFFERADLLAGRLDLVVHLMNPDTQAIFGTARLPLLPSE